ncbi:MAG: hypothetical protein HKN13_06120 [Rhodothermales bacterium]|nr:hypothetical protein [Rhodothermales bacterium]
MARSKGGFLGRVKGVLGFFIGIFGAMAILGVFFKIMKLDNYEFFMKVGFIGEAAAFVTMGVLELMSSFAGSNSSQNVNEVAPAAASGAALPSNFAEAVDAKLDAKLDEMLVHFASDIDRFRVEMNSLSGEISHSRAAVSSMRSHLEQVSTADLAGDADRMGKGMAILGTEMASAGHAVESMRSDLELLAQRFRSFNGGMPTTNGKADKPPVGRSVV